MKFSDWNKRYIKPIPVIVLLAMVALTITGCEDFGQFPQPQTPAQKPEPELQSTAVKTADRAILAVYEHLLSQAESYQAKAYIADFYTICDNWSAKSEVFKDGSRIWYVAVNMTAIKEWEERPYWQQASWFVLQDGKVIPSHRFQANALRIEADLQELSLPPEPTLLPELSLPPEP